MFEHQRIAKLGRKSTPAVAESIAPPPSSWTPTAARPREAEGPQQSGARFDIGNISIFPPEGAGHTGQDGDKLRE
jgi:hypothetical protein